jgi:toxin-antitoxin system PIN domain toxin
VTYVLDVNVLIALLDHGHIHHERATTWFIETGRTSWATCPLTENGVLRILGHVSYPGGPGSAAGAAELLMGMRDSGGHVFWPDEISLLDDEAVRLASVGSSSHLTDVYLLALAVRHAAQLATLDRRIPVVAVAGGAEALALVT